MKTFVRKYHTPFTLLGLNTCTIFKGICLYAYTVNSHDLLT